MKITISFETLPIRVDFPALSDLVDYLRDLEQQQIDATAATVQESIDRLRQSTAVLSTAVNPQEK